MAKKRWSTARGEDGLTDLGRAVRDIVLARWPCTATYVAAEIGCAREVASNAWARLANRGVLLHRPGDFGRLPSTRDNRTRRSDWVFDRAEQERIRAVKMRAAGGRVYKWMYNDTPSATTAQRPRWRADMTPKEACDVLRRVHRRLIRSRRRALARGI